MATAADPITPIQSTENREIRCSNKKMPIALPAHDENFGLLAADATGSSAPGSVTLEKGTGEPWISVSLSATPAPAVEACHGEVVQCRLVISVGRLVKRQDQALPVRKIAWLR